MSMSTRRSTVTASSRRKTMRDGGRNGFVTNGKRQVPRPRLHTHQLVRRRAADRNRDRHTSGVARIPEVEPLRRGGRVRDVAGQRSRRERAVMDRDQRDLGGVSPRRRRLARPRFERRRHLCVPATGGALEPEGGADGPSGPTVTVTTRAPSRADALGVSLDARVAVFTARRTGHRRCQRGDDGERNDETRMHEGLAAMPSPRRGVRRGLPPISASSARRPCRTGT